VWGTPAMDQVLRKNEWKVGRKVHMIILERNCLNHCYGTLVCWGLCDGTGIRVKCLILGLGP
jgi:hypothetical protein